MKKLIILLLFIPLVFSCSGDDEPSQPEKYTLTVNINPSGAGVVNPNGGTVNAGDQITLTQAPNSNFFFKDWTGDASGNSDSVTIIMDRNKTVTANYTQKILIESNGTIKCPDAKVGDKETINGKEYEVVDANSLIKLIDDGKDVTCVCTTFITSMDNLMNPQFVKQSVRDEFNQDISNWDVSNVTDMSGMFSGLILFNQDLNKWDVSNVETMERMFGLGGTAGRQVTVFNGNISSWDVSKVTNMSDMFYANQNFNKDISNWDVSKVTDMSGMFKGNPFNQDISNWDVSKVTNMSIMFGYTNFNQDISNWDVSKVTDMSNMFVNAKAFNQDIGKWDVSNVTDMSSMFLEANAFNQNISTWNTAKVFRLEYMFYGATVFNQDLTKWCVTNITSEPNNFSTSSALTEANKPKWGTCP